MIAEVRGRPRWWQIGRFRFDAVTRRLDDGSTATALPTKAADVLLLLAERRGDVVLRDELVREVWDGNQYTGSRALTQAVWRLRQVLDGDVELADGASAIRTVSKTGYQLMLPAVPRADPSAGASLDAAPDAVPAASAATLAATEAMPMSSATGVTTPTDPKSEPERSPALALQRPRRAAFALAAAMLVVLAAAAVALWPRRLPPDPGRGVDAAAPEALTSLDGVEDFPAYSADGRRLAFVWTHAGEPQRVRIVDLHAVQTPPVDIAAEPGFRLSRPMWLGEHALAYVRAHEDGAGCEVFALDLATQARRRLTDCRYQPNLPFVDASPDGRWLALSRTTPGVPAAAVVLRDVRDGSERVLTRPGPALDDGQISFSRSGRQVAFVRGSLAVGDVWVVDVATGRETRLTNDQAPVGGLSWLSDDSGIVFSSVRDGSFADWRVDAGGGTPTLFSRAQAATNLAAVPGEPDVVAASLHRFADAIQVYAPGGGDAPRSTVASNGRNLYAQTCGSDRMVFVSTRGGRIAVWASDLRGEHPRALPMPAGTPDTPSCNAAGDRWATAMRAPGAAFDSLVIGRLDGDEAPLVVAPSASLNNVAWAHDGRSLIVASDREAGWDLWRFDLETRRFDRLTDDHGSFGREVDIGAGRWLYYTRLDQRGLWRRALDGGGLPVGAPQRVSDRLDADDWGNWQWHDGALWLIERASDADRLLRCDELGRDTHVVRTLPPRLVRRFRSLSIDEAGTLVLSTAGAPQADIVRLRGPQPARGGG